MPQMINTNVASLNAQRNINTSQTALSTALERLSSGLRSNSASDRASLDAETTQLIAEITRVSGQTSFNGTVLLDGSFTAKTFQVGANANQTISVASIADARATGLGSNILLAAGTLMGTTKAAAADLTGGNTVAAGDGPAGPTGHGGPPAA